MGRLIDTEELLEVLEEFITYDPFDIYKEEPLLNISFEQMEDIIEEIPTVKPAKINVKNAWIFIKSIWNKKTASKADK